MNSRSHSGHQRRFEITKMEKKLFCVCLVVIAACAVTLTEAQPPYNLGYNYFDQMAQSYCAASSTGWVFAVRRDCHVAPTCNDICQTAKAGILTSIANQRTNVKCFDAFNIVKQHAYLSPNSQAGQPDQAMVAIGTHGYGAGGCTWRANHCGPNYCCCSAY